MLWFYCCEFALRLSSLRRSNICMQRRNGPHFFLVMDQWTSFYPFTYNQGLICYFCQHMSFVELREAYSQVPWRYLGIGAVSMSSENQRRFSVLWSRTAYQVWPGIICCMKCGCIMYFLCVWWKRCGSNFTYNTVYSSCTMSWITVLHSHNCNPKHLFKLPNRVFLSLVFLSFTWFTFPRIMILHQTVASPQSPEQYCKVKTPVIWNVLQNPAGLSVIIPCFSSTSNILYHIISLAPFFYKKLKKYNLTLGGLT